MLNIVLETEGHENWLEDIASNLPSRAMEQPNRVRERYSAHFTMPSPIQDASFLPTQNEAQGGEQESPITHGESLVIIRVVASMLTLCDRTT